MTCKCQASLSIPCLSLKRDSVNEVFYWLCGFQMRLGRIYLMLAARHSSIGRLIFVAALVSSDSSRGYKSARVIFRLGGSTGGYDKAC